MDTREIWTTLITTTGLSAFLAVIVLPTVKALFNVSGRATLLANFIAGQLLAQGAMVYLHGFSGKGAADAFLVGLIAAGMATGLHQGYKAATGKLP